MYAYMIKVKGGKEVKTAYLMDLFFEHYGMDDKIHISTFEREKYQKLDEGFRKGVVGYMLLLSLEPMDYTIWYNLKEYLHERNHYAAILDHFDVETLKAGPFLHAVIEKMNDFIDDMNASIFSSYFQKVKKRVKGIVSYVHTLLDDAKLRTYNTYVRWVSYVKWPVSVIDTG